MTDDPRYGCGWALLFSLILWIVILGVAALIVSVLS